MSYKYKDAPYQPWYAQDRPDKWAQGCFWIVSRNHGPENRCKRCNANTWMVSCVNSCMVVRLNGRKRWLWWCWYQWQWGWHAQHRKPRTTGRNRGLEEILFVFTLSDILQVEFITGQPSTRRGRGFRQTTGDIFLSETFNPIFKMCKKVDLKQQFAKFGKSFYPMTTCEKFVRKIILQKGCLE